MEERYTGKEKEERKYKGREKRAKRVLVFVWMGRRPAELGRSPASDSSCGLSFISSGGAWTVHQPFYLQLSCFQSEGTINYCQQ